MSWRPTRKRHRCQTPEPTDVTVGYVWTCTCGRRWELMKGHHEERVYMGGADADIGYDYIEWVGPLP